MYTINQKYQWTLNTSVKHQFRDILTSEQSILVPSFRPSKRMFRTKKGPPFQICPKSSLFLNGIKGLNDLALIQQPIWYYLKFWVVRLGNEHLWCLCFNLLFFPLVSEINFYGPSNHLGASLVSPIYSLDLLFSSILSLFFLHLLVQNKNLQENIQLFDWLVVLGMINTSDVFRKPPLEP